MCLRTNENHYKVADKPITCYKTASTIIQRPTARTLVQRFRSQFYNFEYELDTLYSLKETDDFILNNPVVGRTLHINVGFHSFATLEQAKDDCLEYDKDYIKRFLTNWYLPTQYTEVILKCEIPEGAKYWVGNRDLTYKNFMEYCSNQIKVVGWKFKGENNWRKAIVKS